MLYEHRWIPWVCVVLTMAVVLSTVYGVIHFYSPIPFWDMWNGYLEFYYRSFDDGWTPWWELHNEHRLVLAKALFWLELSVFKGDLKFLFLLNLVFPLLIFIAFAGWLRRSLAGDEALLRQPLLYLLLALAFSWAQHENFTWAFQSQFYMAYLLPLLAFYCLSLSDGKDRYFPLSGLLGVLSAVTMANGLLALPLLAVQAAVQRLGWRPVITMMALAVVVIVLYLHDYERPEWHSGWSENLAAAPLWTLVYFLSYLGGPFYALTGGWTPLAVVAGILLIVGSCCLAWPVLQGRRLLSSEGGLLAFLLFIGGTALNTALGRAALVADLEYFLAPRYLTPSLMAWSAFFILLHSRFVLFRGWPQALLAILGILALLAAQRAVLEDNTAFRLRTPVVLTATVGVRDEDAINRIYFNPERFYRLTHEAIASGHSVGRIDMIKTSAALMHKPYPYQTEVACRGYLDRVVEKPLFNGQEGYGYRLEGWLVQPEQAWVPAQVILLEDALVTGYGATAITRHDVAEIFGTGTRRSGFYAWMTSDQPLLSGDVIKARGREPDCQLELVVP